MPICALEECFGQSKGRGERKVLGKMIAVQKREKLKRGKGGGGKSRKKREGYVFIKENR